MRDRHPEFDSNLTVDVSIRPSDLLEPQDAKTAKNKFKWQSTKERKCLSGELPLCFSVSLSLCIYARFASRAKWAVNALDVNTTTDKK